MADRKEERKRKKTLSDVGSQMPSNLKFGLIVMVAVFWAEFIRSLLTALFDFIGAVGPVVVDLIIAATVSVLAYLLLLSYRKLQYRLKKIKV